MPGRMNYQPYDVTAASVSVLTPSDEGYRDDAAHYGVDDPAGQWIAGIGADYPDVVLVGSRDDLVAIGVALLDKLGAAR